MEQTHSVLEIARFITGLTELPVIVFEENKLLGTFSGAVSEPIIHAHSLWYLKNIIGASETEGAYEPRTIQSDLSEDFLDFGTQIDGKLYRILAGPFLLNRTPAAHRKQALEILGFELNHERIGESYLAALRKLSTDDIKNLQFLLFMTRQFLQKEQTGRQSAETLVEDYYRGLIANQESYYHHPPFQLEKQLLEHIRSGQEDAARDMANQLYTHPDARLAGTPIRSYRNSLICRCTLYTRAAIDGGATTEAAFTLSDVMINEIEKIDSVQELYHLDLSMIRSFCEMSQTPNKSDYSLIIRRAQQYIGENIYEKLSVSAIARHLYVHPNYLSNLFRKETGQSVTEYILQNKIKESQNMLSYSKNTVTDISNFLGFSSQSHFGLAFRKVTGVTPVQYRKLHFREY